MKLREKTLSTKEIFTGRIIKVKVDTVSLPNGSESTREIVEHAEAVAIIAIDDELNIWMVRQYRKPVEQVLLEIPAGVMEPDEDPLESAKRELAEETGLRAQKWEKVLSYYSAPGFTDEKLHIYLATNLESGETHPDEDEFVEVQKIPLKNAAEMILNGQIMDGKSIIGIQWAIRHFNI